VPKYHASFHVGAEFRKDQKVGKERFVVKGILAKYILIYQVVHEVLHEGCRECMACIIFAYSHWQV
jgi:hypothetical protein